MQPLPFHSRIWGRRARRDSMVAMTSGVRVFKSGTWASAGAGLRSASHLSEAGSRPSLSSFFGGGGGARRRRAPGGAGSGVVGGGGAGGGGGAPPGPPPRPGPPPGGHRERTTAER